MRRKIIYLIIIILVFLGLVAGLKLYKEYSNKKRYEEIKEDVQEETARYLSISAPYCTPGSGDFMITDETLIYQRGMDKEKLLDIDKKSYCKVRIEVTCVNENEFAWDTYLKCKDYEDVEYGNLETRK